MAGIIAKDTIEDVRQASDIADVLGSYLTLTRKGTRLAALCPFHKEKTASFYVNTDWQSYHCFGCGASGDVFKFLMEYEGLDFTGAVKQLAARANITLQIDESGRRDGPDKTVLYEILQKVATGYHEVLRKKPAGEVGRRYLAERDMSDESVESFMVGFAPSVRAGLLRWGQRQGYTAEQLESAGLISKSDHGTGENAYYDRFRDRLMFPIWDEQGRIIGFSGRILDSTKKAAKYVNSPETPLFKKSRILYGLHMARRNIVDEREAILCEGQIDVIRCHSVGIQNAVAAQGTAFTEGHARILKRYADVVVILFDADKAGQEAAVKTGHILLEMGLEVRVATLPGGDDPDSYIKAQGPDAFRTVIKDSGPLLEFHIHLLTERDDVESEAGMMRITKAIMETIGRSPNAVQRAILLERAAGRLQIPVQALQSDYHHHARRQAPRRAAPTPGLGGAPATTRSDAPASDVLVPPAEFQLAGHMLYLGEAPELLETLKTYLPLDRISHPSCRAYAACCIDAWEHRGGDLRTAILEQEESPGSIAAFAARVQADHIPHVGSAEATRLDALQDIILRLWRAALEQQRSAVESIEERQQLTYDLQLLKSWETGRDLIATLIHI